MFTFELLLPITSSVFLIEMLFIWDFSYKKIKLFQSNNFFLIPQLLQFCLELPNYLDVKDSYSYRICTIISQFQRTESILQSSAFITSNERTITYHRYSSYYVFTYLPNVTYHSKLSLHLIQNSDQTSLISHELSFLSMKMSQHNMLFCTFTSFMSQIIHP